MMGQSELRDEAFPDGLDWRCRECGSPVAYDGNCPKHPDAYLERVNRRITFGPGPDDYRDVVVESRESPSRGQNG